jgi:hypothetical protein
MHKDEHSLTHAHQQRLRSWLIPISIIKTVPSVFLLEVLGFFCPSAYVERKVSGFSFQAVILNVLVI